MATFIDFYRLLGVDPLATSEQIKDAYRTKMHEAHPDRHGGSEQANRAARALNEARDVLLDPSSRQRFDVARQRRSIRRARRLAQIVRAESARATPERPVPEQVVADPTPWPGPPAGDDLAFVTCLRLGVGVAAMLILKNRYDSDAERYRDGRGRFRRGWLS